jgi:hypothetical protein
MENEINTPEIMSRKQTAKFIGICLTTLDRLDIPKTKVSQRIFYKAAVVRKWLDDQTEKKRSK